MTSMPHSIEAEMALLGSIIIDPRMLDEVLPIVGSGSAFYRTEHGWLFDALCEFVSTHPSFDLVQFDAKVSGDSEYESLGGGSYLAQLAESVPSAVNAAHYAKIVADRKRTRDLIDAANQIVWEATQEGAEADDAIAAAQERMLSIGEAGKASDTLRSADSLVRAVEDRIRTLQEIGPDWVPSGFPEIDRIIGGFRPGELIVIAARPGVGKAQPVDCKVMTPRGWSRIGDIRVGDTIAGRHGWTRVNGVYPQGVKPVYRVTMHDGSSTRCCNEHLWLTTNRNERRYGAPSVKSLAEIRSSLWRADSPSSANHYIPWASPIAFAQADLPMDPYLLGAWLGDGCGIDAVKISNPEPWIHERVAVACPSGSASRSLDNGGTISVVATEGRFNPATHALREIGLSGKRSYEKFIPSEYQVGSIEQRLSLLRGLCDTDGHVSQGSYIDYVTTSCQLAVDIQSLVRSLGGRCSITPKKTWYTKPDGSRVPCRDAYRLHFHFNNGIVPVSSPKHLAKWSTREIERWHQIVSVEPDGDAECVCISVDAADSLYITDDFIVTHNTAIGINLCQRIAMGAEPRGVAYFSLEMSGESLMQRMLSSECRIDGERIRDGNLSFEESERLAAGMAKVRKAKIHTDDTPSLGIAQLRARCRACVRRYGVAVLFIDYLQLVQPDKTIRQPRHVQVGEITAGLKQMARELSVPVVCFAQLSRASENRTDGRPRTSDLRESGSIEQDADVVAMLHRESQFHMHDPKWLQDNEATINDTDFIVAKNRNGATGVATLVWQRETTSYLDLSQVRRPQPKAQVQETVRSAKKSEGIPWE